MEQSEGGEQSQPQPQPWGKLIRLGADEKEPHVLLLKREWTIGRKKDRIFTHLLWGLVLSWIALGAGSGIDEISEKPILRCSVLTSLGILF
ncbi:hypothetical protein HGM15179_003966 [Zosterops borbonicus]|uniref:Uncharacterized protein n=1 Tax=Zosterops borbonicus TaxID=364589 RepID=A0A8K1GQW9_9PASS|nr:hypothetical protein HGM15179_003966 [Zosterops borbonicus]